MNSVLEGEKLVGTIRIPSFPSLPLLKANPPSSNVLHPLSLPLPQTVASRISSSHVVEGRRRIEEATKMSPFDFTSSRSSSSSKVQFPVLNVPKCRLLLCNCQTNPLYSTLYLLPRFSFFRFWVDGLEGWRVGGRTRWNYILRGERGMELILRRFYEYHDFVWFCLRIFFFWKKWT